MFPSPDDKRLRLESAQIDVPTSPNGCLTPESVCAFIAARLRYDFISGKDSVNAYVDITQPWQCESFPSRSPHGNAVPYVHALEDLLFQTMDRSEALGRLDPMLYIYFRKVIIRSHYHGIFRVSVCGTVTEQAVHAAA